MIYLIIDNRIYNYIIEYVVSINNNIPNSKILIFPKETIKKINNEDKYIYFGIHYVKYPIYNLKNIYFINLEQLTINGKYSSLNLLQKLLDIVKKNSNCNILDYSLANISILKEYNIKSMYIPYQVNYNEIFNYKKEINFVICSTLNHRADVIFNNISNKIDDCVYIGKPLLWGTDRDNILFKTKVLANIHNKDKIYNILEEIRITRCILNKIIVISEYSFEYEKYPLHKYVIFVEYDKMENKIMEVLNNYEHYYNKIYKKLNINEIDKTLKSYIDIFLQTL
jgi:hypothetical protein